MIGKLNVYFMPKNNLYEIIIRVVKISFLCKIGFFMIFFAILLKAARKKICKKYVTIFFRPERTGVGCYVSKGGGRS